MKPLESYMLTSESGRPIDVSRFGLVDYQVAYTAMANFASNRPPEANDQIWLIQHPPVYTQGTACEIGAFLPSAIPTVKTDRGGQITYHGPGQIVMYPMLSLKQYGMGVKSFVAKLEQCVIDVLADLNIDAARRDDAPGVYVEGAKIAALGLRIRRGTSYHGLSFNIDMDLSPFTNIDPCGYQGLKVTQVSALLDQQESATHSIEKLSQDLLQRFVKSL